MPIERIKSKLSDILYVKSYSCYNITKKNDRTTKAIAAKGIDYKRYCHKRYRLQKVSATKVSETKGVDFYFSLVREGDVTYVAAAHLRLKKNKWSLIDKSARKPRKIKKKKQIGQFIC